MTTNDTADLDKLLADCAGHTPEPWEIRTRGDPKSASGYVLITESRGVPICEVRRTSEHWEDNAALIARAPDLLAEVERLRADNERLVEALDKLVCVVASNERGLSSWWQVLADCYDEARDAIASVRDKNKEEG